MPCHITEEDLSPPSTPAVEVPTTPPEREEEVKRIEIRYSCHALARYCKILDLDHGVTDLAQGILKKVYDRVVRFSKNCNGTIAACIFQACRERPKSITYAKILSLVRTPIGDGLVMLLAVEMAYDLIRSDKCYGNNITKPEFSGIAPHVVHGQQENIWTADGPRVLVSSNYDSRDLPLQNFCGQRKEDVATSECPANCVVSEQDSLGKSKEVAESSKMSSRDEEADWVFVGKDGESMADERHRKADSATTQASQSWSGAFGRRLFH